MQIFCDMSWYLGPVPMQCIQDVWSIISATSMILSLYCREEDGRPPHTDPPDVGTLAALASPDCKHLPQANLEPLKRHFIKSMLAGRLLRHRTFAHRAAWDRSFREAFLRAEQAPPQSSDSHLPRHPVAARSLARCIFFHLKTTTPWHEKKYRTDLPLSDSDRCRSQLIIFCGGFLMGVYNSKEWDGTWRPPLVAPC